MERYESHSPLKQFTIELNHEDEIRTIQYWPQETLGVVISCLMGEAFDKYKSLAPHMSLIVTWARPNYYFHSSGNVTLVVAGIKNKWKLVYYHIWQGSFVFTNFRWNASWNACILLHFTWNVHISHISSWNAWKNLLKQVEVWLVIK